MSQPKPPPGSAPPGTNPTPSASPRLSSALVMTPQLQLAIRLLGATPRELAALVEHEAAENPALEFIPAPVDALGDAVIASVEEGRLMARSLAAVRLAEPTEGATDDQRKSAEWLVHALEQRERTVLRVVEALLERQRDYLNGNRERPVSLTRRVIAEALGIHESTVTRIVERKALCCARGVVALTDLLER